MKKLKIITCLIPLLLLVGCCIFPQKQSSSLQQQKALETSISTLANSYPEVAFSLDESLVEKVLVQEIEVAMLSNSSDELIVKKVRPKVELIRQGINLNSEYDIYIPKYKVTAKGSFKGVIGITSKADKLLFYPALVTFKIDKLDSEDNGPIIDGAARLVINSLVSVYMDSLNSEIFSSPTIMDLGWKGKLDLDKNNYFNEGDIVAESNFPEVRIFNRSAVLLVTPNALSGFIDISYDERDTYDEESGGNVTVTGENFDGMFRAYERNFSEKVSSVFNLTFPGEQTGIYLSKGTMSATLNSVFDGQLKLKKPLLLPKENLDSKIEFDRKQIDCSNLREPFRYKRYRRDRCNWSCGDLDPVCHSTRTACNVREEGRVAADNVAREIAKAAHDTLQEAKIHTCKEARASSEVLAAGRFKGSVEATGDASASIGPIMFSEGLTFMNVSLGFDIDAKLKTKFNIQPNDLGYLIMCISDVQETVVSALNASINNEKYRIDLDWSQRSDDLVFTAIFPNILVNSTLKPSPLKGLTDDNNFSSKCRIFDTYLEFALALGSVANSVGFIDLSEEEKLGLFGKSKFNFTPSRFEHIITPIIITIDDTFIAQAVPVEGTKYIGFELR